MPTMAALQEHQQQYGRRLMPRVLDEQSRTVPEKLFAAIPKSGDLVDGFRDISVSDMARCVDFMAHWIEGQFGRSDTFETLAYVGIPDLRGVVVVYAAVKCGYKTLVPSPRNPPSTNLSLIQQTGCTKLVHAVEVAPLIKPLVNLGPALRTEIIPSFDQMLNSNPPSYPYEKDFDDAENDPILVLHSSGSTGLPKPIIMTHGSFAVMDNDKNLAEVPGRRRRDWSMWNFEGEARVYTIFPFFHLGGFMAFAFNPVLNNASPVLGPPFMMPDGNLLKTVRNRYKLRSIILPPSIVEQILQEPDSLSLFEDIDFLVTSGAPISPAVGDKLWPVVEIRQTFGVTETFLIPELDAGREEWAYHEWNPNFEHEMQLYDEQEKTYELVVLAGKKRRRTTAVSHNLPDVDVFPTKDLFTRHPTKPQLYRYYGRRDDIVVLANGHKLNPLPLEADLGGGGHPELRGAMIVGNRRLHTVLLVEPKDPLDDAAARDELLERIWPAVQKANTLIAGQGRVQRGNVICVVPERLLVRTGKGTVVRRMTEDLYKNEIERLYATETQQEQDVQQQPVVTNITLKPTSEGVYELPAVVQFLREVMGLSFALGTSISADDDFFSYGLDSVQTLAIVSNLRGQLRSVTGESITWITPRTIFYNPTLNDLARVVAGSLNNKSNGQASDPETINAAFSLQAIEETIKRHVAALPEIKERRPVANKTSTVALIGSTGYVGVHVVATLLRNPTISRVYCLNRAENAQQRQEAALRPMLATATQEDSKDNKSALQLLSKLEYMTVKLGEPQLGLTESQYKTIGAEADIIVYNAWKLDFGLSLRSFEPFLLAARDVINLAIAGPQTSRVLFVSSLSSIGNLSTISPSSPDDEVIVDDARAPLAFGYAHSKHVAERVLATASAQYGIPVSVVRVGQVGGSLYSGRDGAAAAAWPEQRWISALLRTAKTIGTMPTQVSLVDWIPVESVAAVLSSLIIRSEKPHNPGTLVDAFHVYPSQTPPPRWELIVKIMREVHGVTKTLPLPEWTRTLRGFLENAGPGDGEKMPALKVLDFYEASGNGLENVKVGTRRTVAASGIDVRPVDEELVTRWLSEWKL